MPGTLVSQRRVVGDGGYGRRRLLDREADTLAGQGILLAGRIADQ
jgi:hypothetical protein